MQVVHAARVVDLALGREPWRQPPEVREELINIKPTVAAGVFYT